MVRIRPFAVIALFFLITGSLIGFVGLYMSFRRTCYASGIPPLLVRVTCVDPAPLIVIGGFLFSFGAAWSVIDSRLSKKAGSVGGLDI